MGACASPGPPAEDAGGPFRSFWMGGFEGADHINSHGRPLDPLTSGGHLRHAAADYARLARLGIGSVRESVGWRVSEGAAGIDLARVHALIDAAQASGTQILWTLLHYGRPAGLDFEDPQFNARFARFAAAVARAVRQRLPDEVPVYTPINEISFLAWALSETALIHPYRGSSPQDGYRLKVRLAHAAIVAMDAILQVEPRARFMHVDPLIHVVAPPDRPELQAHAAELRAWQWQAWDLLAGRLEPQLGGRPALLDVVGINHYHSSQWETGTERRLEWHLRDARRRPLSHLLADAHARYGRPLVLAETSHVGRGRAQWFDEMAAEVLRARRRGVPVQGFTLYPVLDRHDWDNEHHWHRSGLWDLDAHGARRLDLPYARALRRWQRRFDSTDPRTAMTTLIVFSHLRWDFVHQRPQHLLTRLARHYRVLFVEEPVAGPATAFLERFTPAHNVEVLRPHTAVAAPGFHDDQLPELRALLADYLRDFAITDYVVWFYTPMALPLLAGLAPRAVLYDCMDDLAAFKDAPRQMTQRESALLKTAQVVFTGGPSLYEARRALHPRVLCLPSAVDAAHYAPDPARAEAPQQAHLARPRLGFFGVIDERLDIGLLDALAAARPHWQIVMVGPVVKIDAATLPQRANIHWLGKCGYDELPALVAGWDVCLLPFALNAHTRFISPTKTLEYMAAGKPVVSTAIHDVQALYGDVVRVAADAAGFIASCEAALGEQGAARAERAARMQAHVQRITWDATAQAIRAEIEALRAGVAVGARAAAASAPAAAAPAGGEGSATAPVMPLRKTAARQQAVRTVIVGAGPTGLSAAWHLDADTLLIEREARVGGWCRSVVEGGFTFDYAGHIMFSNDPGVLKLYDTLLGDNQHWQQREAWVRSHGVYTRYPFQGALYGLPPKVLKECILGAIEARFGRLDGSGGPAPATPPANFEEFIHRVWGDGIARHFALPYNRKLWAVPLAEMETSWLGGRVPLPDLGQMIEGALEPVPAPMGPNARFGYPLRGGFQALMDAFVPGIRGELALATSVLAVAPLARTVTLSDGRTVRYDTLISTMPLPALVAACGEAVPAPVRAAAAGLRHVSVRCVNLGVARERITDKHWIYYPEDSVFHRIFVQGNASPHNNPEGGFGLTCEITYSPSKPLPCDGQALIERAHADCVRVGMLRPDDRLLVANQVDMPCAYVVYDHARAANVDTIRQWMAQHGIVLAGRYSEWEYYNSDHAFVAGRRAAEQAGRAALPLAAHAGG